MNTAPIPTPKGTILIVDDEFQNLQLLSQALTQQGYEVRGVITGAMALRAARSASPDLILLDIMLPDLSGYEVCQQLKAAQQTQNIPVIFLSALDDVLDKVRAFAVGGADYVTKPFQLEEVIARVEHQLELQAARAEIYRLNRELEERVQQRTAQLEQANRNLQQEIAERRQSEALFRSIFNNVSVAMGVVDQSGRVLKANEADCAFLGYAPEELLGMHFSEFTHPEDLQLDQQLYEELLKGQRSGYCIEKRYIRKDRKVVWGRLYVSLIRDEQGQPEYTMIVCEDITARKQAEQALQESEERLRDILNSLEEVVWSTSADASQLLYISPAVERVYGRPAADFFNNPNLWLEVVHPEDREQVKQSSRSLAEKGSKDNEYRILRPDGTVRWLRDRASLTRNAEGNPIRRDGIAYDITERKQAEETLRQWAEQQKLVAAIAHRIRQSLDLNTILNTTVNEVRQFLRVDRVLVYRFRSDWSGMAAVESVSEPQFSVMGAVFEDHCFAQGYIEKYRLGGIQSVEDIHTANLSPCHVDLLAAFQVKANLVVPIIYEETLWGLLIANHCKAPRPWSPIETDLLKQLSTQLAIAIQQSELYQQVQEFNLQLEQLVQERTAQLQQARNFDALLKRITDRVRDSLDENQILRAAVRELALGLDVISCDTALYNLEQQTSTVCHEYTQTENIATLGTVCLMSDFPELYSQLLNHQWFQFCNPHVARGQITALLACPIFDDQGVLGDLWLSKPSQEVFTEQEIQLVQQVANQCAIAIRQARLYAASQAQVETLEKLNQLKDDFLSTVSHELRSPVTNMKMAIQMLNVALRPVLNTSSEPSERVLLAETARQRLAQYLQILESECDREINLVNDLLDLQRLEADAQPLIPKWIDLNLWLPTLVDSFQERVQVRQQHLRTEIPEPLPPIQSDLDALSRILSELLHNACKYTPPGERIVVAVRTVGGDGGDEGDGGDGGATSSPSRPSPSSSAFPLSLQISVTNFGVEIPADELPHIFEKFYRVISTDRWQQGGTGLGLTLVRKLVEYLGGTVAARSAKGQTTLIVQLPQQQDQGHRSLL